MVYARRPLRTQRCLYRGCCTSDTPRKVLPAPRLVAIGATEEGGKSWLQIVAASSAIDRVRMLHAPGGTIDGRITSWPYATNDVTSDAGLQRGRARKLEIPFVHLAGTALGTFRTPFFPETFIESLPICLKFFVRCMRFCFSPSVSVASPLLQFSLSSFWRPLERQLRRVCSNPCD